MSLDNHELIHRTNKKWTLDDEQHLVQLYHVYGTAYDMYLPVFPNTTVSQIRCKVNNMKHLIKEEIKRNQKYQDNSSAIKVTHMVQTMNLPTTVPTITPAIVDVFHDQTQIFQQLSASESNGDSSEIQIIANNDQEFTNNISCLFGNTSFTWDVFDE
ncbi:Hypothetical_protein [Hexamita inflata]|uniref:Hypothetical_protein n=1 Tax=Hexamita inflata TaxID=28002 RepID=A0AA86NMC6_9EUKA|nr:Hypothetical protein HINF_LOCUS9544 [Hexamita inflata]